jgi:hypothetical protein
MSPKSHERRQRGKTLAVLAGTVVVIAGGALGYRQVEGDGGGSPPVPGTANIWIDTTAGSCLDSTTAVSYSNAASCTWDGANDTCEAGDTVRVMGGSYGDVTLTSAGQTTRSSGTCTITTADGETVTIDEFQTGHVNDTAGSGASRLTLVGPTTAKAARADEVNNISFDDWVVDAQFDDPDNGDYSQIVHFENTTTVSFSNGEIKNACAETGQGGMIVLIGDGPTTLNNNLIHDAHACDPGGDPHTECIWASATNNVNLTRNKFWKCAVMDVFITGWDGDTYASNWTIENNFFGRSCGDNENPHVCESPQGNTFHFRNGAGGSGDPAPIPSGFVIRHNTFRGNLSVNGGGSPPSPNVIKGNIFLDTAACGVSNTTYSYNAHVSGSCGGTGSFNDAGLGSDFVDPDDFASDGGDWMPSGGGAQVNVGNASDYPALDILGVSRFDGSAPDIGAWELQE